MRQPRLRHNDYTVLDVPNLGEWEPNLAVSVVIPAYGQQDKLDLTLASLSAQSYPDRLLEVVVVDDGSSPPITLPELAPANTRLVRSSADGWGPAHAVNVGVRAASHGVILRLDADMVGYREHVEAHMRWHHLADYLTVMGSVAYTEHNIGGPTAVDVLEYVANGKAVELFDVEQARTSWVENVYETTDNLLRAGNRAFEVAVGATISFSRRLYDESGGLDTSMVLGSDTEFGYRLAQVGAVFVPDGEARSWHLGLSQMGSRTEEDRGFQAPFIGQRVPLLKDHRRDHGRQWSIPYVDVVVNAADSSYEDVTATVVGALTGSFVDVGVSIVGPWGVLSDERRPVLDDPLVDLRLVREAFAGDGRVRYVESVPATSFPAPFRFRCPAGLVLKPDGLRRLIEETEQRLDGLVLLPVQKHPMLPIARLERTEAVARARALKDADEDLEDVVHELFGVRWISGSGWVLALASDAPEPVPMDGLLAEAQKWKRIADSRETALEKALQEAASWKKAAQVPLEARLKQAVKHRLTAALRPGA
jgi:glycosyltransferase involved in cell wall biosynthesis